MNIWRDLLQHKGSILGDGKFRIFFIGSSVSRLGDGLLPVAFALEAYEMSRSGSGITSVLLSLWIARFITVPIGGRVADRRSRLAVMLCADTVRSAAQGGLAVALALAAHAELWYLCASAALYGIATGFFIPAQVGLIPKLVEARRLRDANSMLSIVADVSSLAGPALAGVIMVSLGFIWVLWFDCITFLVNLLTVAWLMASGIESSERRSKEGAVIRVDHQWEKSDATFSAAVRSLRSFRWFAHGLLLWFAISAGIGVVAVAGPVISVNSFGGTYAWVVLSTSLAVGSLLGSIAIASYDLPFSWQRAAVLVALGFCIQLAALAFRNNLNLALVIIMFACGSAAVAACGVVWNSVYQRELPGRYLSRMASLEGFCNSVGVPTGMLAAGLIDRHLDALLWSMLVWIVLACVPAVVTASNLGERTVS
jgi:MFS family permease